jgi:hypothetical protein
MSYKYTKLHFHYHDLKKKSFLPNLCNKKAFKIYLFLFQNYHFSKKSSEFQFLIKKSLYFIIKATKHPSWIVKLFTILSSVYDIMSMVTYIGPFKKYSQTASSEKIMAVLSSISVNLELFPFVPTVVFVLVQ